MSFTSESSSSNSGTSNSNSSRVDGRTGRALLPELTPDVPDPLDNLLCPEINMHLFIKTQQNLG